MICKTSKIVQYKTSLAKKFQKMSNSLTQDRKLQTQKSALEINLMNHNFFLFDRLSDRVMVVLVRRAA